jgi:hypothetical protein
MAGRRRRDPVYLVTRARKPRSVDIRHRERDYLISMGIRTACLILAIFVFHGLLRWVAVAAAVVLPYFAVIFANAGPALTEEEPTPVPPEEPKAIPSARPAIEGDSGPDRDEKDRAS